MVVPLNPIKGAFQREEVRKAIFVIAFISPFLITLIVIYGLPSLLCFLMSLTDMGLDFKFDWLSPPWYNYIKIMECKDPYIPDVLYTTILYVGATLLINSPFALILGIFTTYSIRKENLAAILRLLWFLPRMTPVVIYGLLWQWFADPYVGPLAKLGEFFGLRNVFWLLDKPYSQILMILVNGYVGASWGMIIFSSSIKCIPLELFYAAKVDGASDWGVIKNIILPLLKWPMLFVTAWQTLSLLGSYVQIMVIWDGAAGTSGTQVWSLYTYYTGFQSYEFGYSAALAMMIVTVALGLVGLYFKVFGFRRMLEPSRVEV